MEMSRAQLFIGRLPKEIRSKELEDIFGRYGKMTRCDVKSGGFLAYAFIDFDDERDAKDAVQYENGRDIGGNRMVVEWAKGPNYRHRGGGRGGGGDRGRGGGGDSRGRSRSPRRRSRSRSPVRKQRRSPSYGNSKSRSGSPVNRKTRDDNSGSRSPPPRRAAQNGSGRSPSP